MLHLLQSRPTTAAHPWACRVINAFGDREVLFRADVRRVLLDCLGADRDPAVALGGLGRGPSVIPPPRARLYG